MTPTNDLHWCGAALHATRDALGRLRERCPDCDGIGEAGASQPTRAITQTPGARCMAPGVGDPFVRASAPLWRLPIALPTPADDAPVPRSVRSIPLTPGTATISRERDRPRWCACGARVPADVLTNQCDVCCPDPTRHTRERCRQRRARREGVA